MFISRKKLERIIEEKEREIREKIYQELDRQRTNENINKRIDGIQTQVWQLQEDVEQIQSKRKLKELKVK